jgi:uncharacterized membrane protein (DUF4010 family)
LGQKVLGGSGLYAVSLGAGLVSSASGAAAAATLASHGTISAQLAGVGVVLNSLASTAVKLPLIACISGDRRLTLRTSLAVMLVIVSGLPPAIVRRNRFAS